MGNVMKPQNHEHKYRLLAIGLGLSALILVGLIIYALLTKKSTHDDGKKQVESSGSAGDVVGGGELQGNEQRGTGKIETECYTFEVPRSVSIGVNQYCAVDMGYGSGQGNLLVVAPHDMAPGDDGKASFERGLEALKKSFETDKVEIKSEDKIKLDGQDAVRFTTASGSEKKIQVYAKSTVGERYDSKGSQVVAVLITTPNETKEQIEVIDGVVKTWKWR